jgi:tetratricopeptide (TPR) repeat protein
MGAEDYTVILDEIGGGGGAALRHLLESVSQWVARPAGSRGGVYHPAAEGVDPGAVPELLLSVEALQRLVAEATPDADTSEAVGLGCYTVAEWAEERGAIGTALAWAQAAIEAWPQQPHYAYLVGRLARKRAEYEMAEAWLRYAMRLARRRMVWEVYALALAGFANLKRQKGNIPAAMRYHRLSLKAARKFGLRTFEGDALYDLAVMCFEVGDAKHAFSYARQAVDAYGPGHSRIPPLAIDIGLFLMYQYGQFEFAAYIFQSLLPYVWEMPNRLLVSANLARAAAAAGWEEVFEKAWLDAWLLMGTSSSAEGHASALVQLSHGAASLNSWERASMAAERGLRIAADRREGKVLVMAEGMLQALRGEMMADQQLRAVFPDLEFLEAAVPPLTPPEAEMLAGELVRAMKIRRDGAPESPARAFMSGR